jgi:hypothetical protein
MSYMAETYMLQALQTGLASIRQTPTQLADILTALNANELAAAQSWFGNLNLGNSNIPNTNRLIIAPGFPMAPEQLPFIGVTVADESQITEQTGIGLEYYTLTDSSGVVTETRGLRFSGTLKATIYTPNADLIVWISSVCKWALMTQFDWLGSDAGGGMNNIQIRLGDYEPQPGFLPIFTFARGISISAEYDLVFSTVPPLITSTTTTPTFSVYK